MTTQLLYFLGPARVERDNTPAAFAQAKGLALLLYLAVTRNAQPRERLVELLWPESMPQAARKNMRNTLWAIGEALGDDLLEQAGGMLRLAPAVVVDIHRLEDALLLLESGTVAALEAATAHYGGPLADGLAVHEAPDFELWLLTERERLATLYLRLLERIIALHRAAGAWDRVLTQARHALAADPAREAIHLAMIEAYIRLGQRPQAIQQYAALTDTLKRELDVAPLPETTARYQALLADQSLPAPAALRPSSRAPAPRPFVGRAAELAALDHERASASLGEARIVLISGDLGMGKTHLWQTWASTHAGDAIVVTTHALETAEPLPFGPVMTLFRQPGPAHTILHPPSPIAPIWLAELVRLLPELAVAWPDLPPPLALAPAEERARLLQALTEALLLLANPLLVLIIDDLHWADPSTLDWLISLIDQLQDAPLLLIGAYRPQDAAERLLATVASWQRHGRLRQLPLAHLSVEEAQRLLATLGMPDDPQQAAEWVRQSGGNPYFLIELQRSASSTAPCDLASLVRARLQATVPAHAVQVLQAAAILGDSATFAALQATSGRSEEETLDALDVLDTAGVLSAQDRTYRFVHPLVATIVRMDLRPARRAFLHRRAAEAIERAHAPHTKPVAGLLMEHYAAAGELGRAAQAAEQAAQHALEVGAFVEAPAYARRALDWEPTPRRQLLLGETLITAGNAGEVQSQLETALHALEQDGDRIGAVRACLRLATIAIGTGQPDGARRWLARGAIQQVETLDPALSAQALQVAAFVERQKQSYPAAAELLDQAEQMAREHQLIALRTQIAFERGNLFANRGDLSAALAAFEEALQLARSSADRVFEAMALNNLAYHTLLNGEIIKAQQYIDSTVALSEQYALGFFQQYLFSTMGEIMLARGERERAEAAFGQAYEAAQAWGNHAHMANVRANQALVAQARNDWSQARELLEAARIAFGNAIDPIVREKIARIGAALAQLTPDS